MFDLGWTELLLIGIVALIVVGPKDLPGLFRSVGQFVGKAKSMAREFSRAMEDAADESGARDLGKSLKAAVNPVGSALDGVKDAAKEFTKWTPEANEMDDERKAVAKKIQDATAKKAAEKRASEEAAKGGEVPSADAAPKPAAPAKTGATGKTVGTGGKTAAAKTAPKAPAKTATKKPAVKKPAEKAATKAPAKAAAKAPAKKPAATKPAAKTTAAKSGSED